MYDEWSKQYGDMVYLDLFGQSVLVLSSMEAINELLEKRGSIYSDRVIPPSLSMIKFNDWAFVTMNFDSEWRAYRRTFHQYYNKAQLPDYEAVLEHQTPLFLQQLLSDPGNFMEHTKYLLGAIVLQISYGLSTPSETQSLIDEARCVVQAFSECIQPGRFLVDTFPILRHVPSWLPGAGWKRKLMEAGRISSDLRRRTFSEAQERFKLGNESEIKNVANMCIAELPPKDHPDYLREEDIARATALTGYFAGVDTTDSSALAMYIALANNPECQRIVQEELDATVGCDRLPQVSDLPRLPYLQALIMEVSRWHSVSPLAVPHVTSQDDQYNGYFIPKGTVVMGNAWAILHDPKVFDDPFKFKPERYLTRDPATHELCINTAVLDPEAAAFGFGRRICPGRHLSLEVLTFMAASLLATFNINAPKDAEGNSIEVKLEPTNALVVKPKPFKVDIVPRSARHAALITGQS
ncbi:O-methylsterigmatocystin oxidoreductase [Coprinopsis sp. MPI-PUGE-AT-0042]|nr:O-methylsterigmatocystin oxidoreductase [Coprinopsis sp. MPI-PUGE-AT-0042]